MLADPDRVGQVLLLENALQYTPAGGRVEIRARVDSGRVTITVADTGIGIPAEHLTHVFDRFYRVDRSRGRTSGGSGIGLTIARHLSRPTAGRSGQKVRGRGSTFTVTLPTASSAP